jgi:hypothetical protein
MPAPRPSRLSDLLLSRPVGATAAAISALIFLGCLSLSFDRHYPGEHAEEGIMCHHGEVRLAAGAEEVVYYPLPFASPPNLELTSQFNWCELVKQCEDRFIVRNTSSFQLTAEWKARGPKPPPPVGPAIAAPPPVAPAAAPPPEPDKLPPPKPVPVNP